MQAGYLQQTAPTTPHTYHVGDTAQVARSDGSWSACKVIEVNPGIYIKVAICVDGGQPSEKIIPHNQVVTHLRKSNEGTARPGHGLPASASPADSSIRSSVPNFAAFLKKLDARITSEADIEISATGDLLLKEVKGVEVGDLFVVKHGFSAPGGQLSQDDVGIVALVGNTGEIEVVADKQEVPLLIGPSQFVNIRLVPKGLRHLFRQDYGSGYIKTFDKEKNGVADIVEEIKRVDDIIANAMGFFDKVLETGRNLSAVEATWSMRENLRTYVLASVMAPAWHGSWASGIPILVASHSRFCSHLSLAAVKGGSACDREIEFVVALMPMMGFKVNVTAKRSEDNLGLLALEWQWKRQRPGADDYIVCLVQYQNVELVTAFAQGMAPEPRYCQAPNLKRIAVVSAPVDDKLGQPINERLNVLLLKMLDGAANRAAEKGFLPVSDWTKSEEDTRVYQEYFDIPRMTLAEMGIKPTA